MSKIYVVGPVIRSGRWFRRGDWPDPVYHAINAVGGGTEFVLPSSEASLESADEQAFYNAIYQRIKSSDGVITIISPNVISGAIEATLASTLGKKQLVIAKTLSDVPRMMRGLPGVVEVVEHSKEASLDEVVSRFVSKYALTAAKKAEAL